MMNFFFIFDFFAQSRLILSHESSDVSGENGKEKLQQL